MFQGTTEKGKHLMATEITMPWILTTWTKKRKPKGKFKHKSQITQPNNNSMNINSQNKCSLVLQTSLSNFQLRQKTSFHHLCTFFFIQSFISVLNFYLQRLRTKMGNDKKDRTPTTIDRQKIDHLLVVTCSLRPSITVRNSSFK